MKHKINKVILPASLLSAIVSGSFSQTQQPNIVIIHTDEHNFRTLGCYRECLQNEQAFPWGKEAVVETPHIDRLAHQGVLFTRCYATSPVSSPSRASFMSGLYPQNNGVWTNDMVLSDAAVTFGESLRQNGYATGYIGKLHINGKGRPEWHPKRDFGFSDNRYMYNRGHWKKIEETAEGPTFRTDADVKSTDEQTFPTDYFTTQAIEFINRHKEGPFCCMLCFPDPHSANLVRPPYDTMYSRIRFKEPATALTDTTGRPAWSHGNNLKADQPEDMAQYFGMIKCIDDNVGRILDALKGAGILDNTIIIFTSDHGDMCRQHGLINKGVPLDDSSRVPFIISYPAGMRQGIRIENVMSVTDFTPSLLSFCNIRPTTQYDGRDLSLLWKGEKLPGGGPFLAQNPDGTVSPQILESSQIDLKDPAKKAMFEQGTHFNPVDLVCALKNHKGEKYNLPDYVDKNTGFISYKSKDGRDLKALELPGLWNGAMSDWNTVFVEVPIETFNPVKTVNDLLRSEHQ